MYCLKIIIKPTAGLTFRILPGSILNIATYPFVPPTTLSGFLRRIGMLKAGLDLPETAINKDNSPYYALPQSIISLGAYPKAESWRTVHKTHRKGMREFNHDFFSRLYISGDKANFQLHTWEYFITEELQGYVVSENLSALEQFEGLEGYGCKLGKEGFAYIEKIDDPLELTQEILAKKTSTLVPMDDLLSSNQFIACDIYNLYRYDWSSSLIQENFLNNQPTPIKGFIPFVAGYYSDEFSSLPTLNYYHNQDVCIPVSFVNLLRG